MPCVAATQHISIYWFIRRVVCLFVWITAFWRWGSCQRFEGGAFIPKRLDFYSWARLEIENDCIWGLHAFSTTYYGGTIVDSWDTYALCIVDSLKNSALPGGITGTGWLAIWKAWRIDIFSTRISNHLGPDWLGNKVTAKAGKWWPYCIWSEYIHVLSHRTRSNIGYVCHNWWSNKLAS